MRLETEFIHHCNLPEGRRRSGLPNWECPTCHAIWELTKGGGRTDSVTTGSIVSVTMRYPDGSTATFTKRGFHGS